MSSAWPVLPPPLLLLACMAVAITIILPRSHSAASSPARTVSRTRLFPARRRRPSRMHPREICVRGGGCNSVCMCARAAGTFVGLQRYGQQRERVEKRCAPICTNKTGQDQLHRTPQRPVSTCLSFLKQIHSPTFCVSCQPTLTESARCGSSRFFDFLSSAYGPAAASPSHAHDLCRFPLP